MIIQTVLPTNEDYEKILSLSDAKAFLRVLDSEDDALITSLIKSAIDEAQSITNLNFANGTFEYYLLNISETLALPRNPVKEIISIELLQNDGSYLAISTMDYYTFIEHGITKIVFLNIPTLINHKKALKITFTSAYENIPQDIVSWLRVRVATLYEHRESSIIGASVSKLTHVDNILSKYKIWSI